LSSTVFPATLPGLLMSLDRDVDFDVTTQTTLTRKENRFTYETIPITKYKLGFEILRSDSSLSNRTRELQQVLTHIARHYGQLDSFLLTDLADSSVSDHGFGVGDGVTTGYQLQRTLAGDIIDAAGVEYAAQTKQYTNMLKNSSFETDTDADGQADNWATYTNSPATEPMWATIMSGDERRQGAADVVGDREHDHERHSLRVWIDACVGARPVVHCQLLRSCERLQYWEVDGDGMEHGAILDGADLESSADRIVAAVRVPTLLEPWDVAGRRDVSVDLERAGQRQRRHE
jgi:hypothetical protein